MANVPVAPDPRFPAIALASNGALVVNQEPVVVERAPNQDAVVTWRLSASGLSFPDLNGVEFAEQFKQYFECKTQKQGAEVQCTISAKLPSGTYKYKINTLNKFGKPKSLDPTVYIE